jgi:hypothetical protein
MVPNPADDEDDGWFTTQIHRFLEDERRSYVTRYGEFANLFLFSRKRFLFLRR